jgi:hypothetical protein
MAAAPIIAVDDGGVFLNGAPVGTLDGRADWKISELHDDLVTLKHNFKLLHPSEGFDGTVIVYADRELDFKSLKRVILSCNVAGYPNVQLIVEERPRG